MLYTLLQWPLCTLSLSPSLGTTHVSLWPSSSLLSWIYLSRPSTSFPPPLWLIASMHSSLSNCPSQVFPLSSHTRWYPDFSCYSHSLALWLPLNLIGNCLSLTNCPHLPISSCVTLPSFGLSPKISCLWHSKLSQHICLLIFPLCHVLRPLPFLSKQLALTCCLILRKTTLMRMAIFWLWPLLTLKHYFLTSLPSRRIICLFQCSRYY